MANDSKKSPGVSDMLCNQCNHIFSAQTKNRKSYLSPLKTASRHVDELYWKLCRGEAAQRRTIICRFFLHTVRPAEPLKHAVPVPEVHCYTAAGTQPETVTDPEKTVINSWSECFTVELAAVAHGGKH